MEVSGACIPQGVHRHQADGRALSKRQTYVPDKESLEHLHLP